jgi:hypothetical protein
MGSGAKSFMRKGFLIYEEMRKYLIIYILMRRPLFYLTLHPIPSDLLIYCTRKVLFSFLSVRATSAGLVSMLFRLVFVSAT